MSIPPCTKQNLITFTDHADAYILKVENNKLKAVKKGLWTWICSSILGLKGYQLSTVLNYIKQNKEALDKWGKSEKFYEIMKDKLKHSKAPIDESLAIFINTLHIPLRDTQTLPHNVLTLIFNQAPNLNVSQACRGFYDVFFKDDTFLKIFKPFNGIKEGLLGRLIEEAKKSLPSPEENDQACQAYLKFIYRKLSTYAQEFGGISIIPTSEKSSIHYTHYQEIATWIENKRLVTFFERFTKAFQGEALVLSIKGKPLHEQAEAIRQFFKTCPTQELNLSNQGLTYIVPEIALLANLEILHLSFNQITELPQELGQLKNLEELYLAFNQIVEIPEKWCQLTSLQVLDLSGNQIKVVPEGWDRIQANLSFEIIAHTPQA